MCHQHSTCWAPSHSRKFSNSLSLTTTDLHSSLLKSKERSTVVRCSVCVSLVLRWWTIELRTKVDGLSSSKVWPSVTMSSCWTISWDTKHCDFDTPVLKLVLYMKTRTLSGCLFVPYFWTLLGHPHQYLSWSTHLDGRYLFFWWNLLGNLQSVVHYSQGVHSTPDPMTISLLVVLWHSALASHCVEHQSLQVCHQVH